jgi:serine/threonine protein phosphatase PrpC
VNLKSDDRFYLEATGATDVGMKRRRNEDVFVIDADAGMYLVADGMGGHAAGEVASRVATDEILRTFKEGPSDADETWPEHWDPGISATANLIVDSIVAGHHRVTLAMDKDADLKGMGTTVVVAVHLPSEGKIVICHVGDSRAYRYRRGGLALLTNDHSWVHEQVEAGFLTEEAARTHPLKNVVTQALGGNSEPKVGVLEVEIDKDDIFLLCSDGLNSMLTDGEIAAVLETGGSLDETCNRLISEANERGGNDNISVVLLRPRSSHPSNTS